MIRTRLSVGDLINVTTSGKCFLITGQNARGFLCRLSSASSSRLIPYSECMKRYNTGIWMKSDQYPEEACK